VVRHQRRYSDAEIHIEAVAEFARDPLHNPFPFLLVGDGHSVIPSVEMTRHTKKNISKAIGNANLAGLDGANYATVASRSEPPIALRTCTPFSSGT